MNYYTQVLRKYAVFSGRAQRKEYWYFFLFNLIIAFALGFIEGFFGIAPESGDSILANIYFLAVLIPSIAVGVRRMHDVNKSGWFIIIPFYNLILAICKGTEGDNKYGSDPKAINNPEDDNKKSRYCHKCGSKIDADSKFCTNCGNKTAINA